MKKAPENLTSQGLSGLKESHLLKADFLTHNY